MSGPMCSRTGEAFCTSAQHKEAIRTSGVGLSAVQRMHWNCCKGFPELLGWQVATGQSRHHVPQQPALSGAGTHCHVRPNAYFGEKLVLK